MSVKPPPLLPRLEGKTLVLRKIRPYDCWSLYRNLHDQDVRQFKSAQFCGPPQTDRRRRFHQIRLLLGLFRKGLRALGLDFFSRNLAEYRFAIVPKEFRKAVGVVMLTELNLEDNCGDIGVLIGKNYWGRGYMLEAESLVFRWAFDVLGLDCIYADVNSENVASYITMKKLGFQKYKSLCQFTDGRGKTVEMVRLELPRANFREL